MNDDTLAALERARAALAAVPDAGHDHRGPDPCPRCGGLPADDAPVTSWHPGEPLPTRTKESE